MIPLKNLIPTDDGSLTLLHPEYGEAMHSTSGAYEEALKKHVVPSGICERNKFGNIVRVLDTGFGLGYNVLAAIHEFSKNSNAKLEIISLEKDSSFIAAMKSIHFTNELNDIYQSLITAYKTGYISTERYSIKIFFGDARKQIVLLEPHTHDAVFHDPFSPAKNPELWTVEYFTALKKLLRPHARLTTYSSAPQVRRALHEAGYSIARAASTGKKREGTVASTAKGLYGWDIITADEIYDDPRSEPYRDNSLCSAREDILFDRTRRLQIARNKKNPCVL